MKRWDLDAADVQGQQSDFLAVSLSRVFVFCLVADIKCICDGLGDPAGVMLSVEVVLSLGRAGTVSLLPVAFVGLETAFGETESASVLSEFSGGVVIDIADGDSAWYNHYRVGFLS